MPQSQDMATPCHVCFFMLFLIDNDHDNRVCLHRALFMCRGREANDAAASDSPVSADMKLPHPGSRTIVRPVRQTGLIYMAVLVVVYIIGREDVVENIFASVVPDARMSRKGREAVAHLLSSPLTIVSILAST